MTGRPDERRDAHGRLVELVVDGIVYERRWAGPPPGLFDIKRDGSALDFPQSAMKARFADHDLYGGDR